MSPFARFLAAAAGLLLATPVAAQTQEDERVWLNLTVQGAIKDRLLYFAEIQPRTRDGVDEIDQLILRPAIGWRATDTLSLYQGYARIIVNPANAPDRFENRTYQQVSWTPGRVGPGMLSLRFRLEQRWLSDGDDTGWRARQLVRYALPLRESGTGVKLLGSVEPFVALDDTDWGARGGFDQVRGFLGVEVPVGGKSTAEIGYLNQFVDRPGSSNAMNHVLSIAVFVRP